MAPVGVNGALKRAAAGAGFSGEEVAPLSGYWPRVGAAQDLMTSGRNLLQIMTAGGWRSVTVLGGYVRAADMNIWE